MTPPASPGTRLKQSKEDVRKTDDVSAPSPAVGPPTTAETAEAAQAEAATAVVAPLEEVNIAPVLAPDVTADAPMLPTAPTVVHVLATAYLLMSFFIFASPSSIAQFFTFCR